MVRFRGRADGAHLGAVLDGHRAVLGDGAERLGGGDLLRVVLGGRRGHRAARRTASSPRAPRGRGQEAARCRGSVLAAVRPTASRQARTRSLRRRLLPGRPRWRGPVRRPQRRRSPPTRGPPRPQEPRRRRARPQVRPEESWPPQLPGRHRHPGHRRKPGRPESPRPPRMRWRVRRREQWRVPPRTRWTGRPADQWSDHRWTTRGRESRTRSRLSSFERIRCRAGYCRTYGGRAGT